MPNPTPHPKGPAPRTPEKLTAEADAAERLRVQIRTHCCIYGCGFHDQMFVACAKIELRKATRQAFEEAAEAVRKACGACDGKGVIVAPDGDGCQCEYCGRPIAAIRALAKEKP